MIDGYVSLDPSGRKGLGSYLFDELKGNIPVIGVAKTAFATATHAKELYRGRSKHPLYITSAGMGAEVAADCIRRMHGEHRFPTLLKRVDRISR